MISRIDSLRERILAAGFDSADIDSIGMHAIPGANVDKELTEEGESRMHQSRRNHLTRSHSLETS